MLIHSYPFYQFGFITSSWKNSFQLFFTCLQSVHPAWKTFSFSSSKMCFPSQRKKVCFLSQTGAFAYVWGTHDVPYVSYALGDSSSQKHSCGTPVAPMHKWYGFAPAERCCVSGEFSGRARAALGSCHLPASRGWSVFPPKAALLLRTVVNSSVQLRSDDDTSLESFCAFCSSVLKLQLQSILILLPVHFSAQKREV